MGDDKQVYTFGEGMPTGPDVAALQRAWPALKIGDKVPYEAVEKIIGAQWNSSRFKSVTTVWRKKEMERLGIVIECLPGKEFYVASNDEITGAQTDYLTSIGRKSRTRYKKLGTIKPETEIQKATKEHHMRQAAVFARESRKMRMNILPPMEPAKQIRIELPKEVGNGHD